MSTTTTTTDKDKDKGKTEFVDNTFRRKWDTAEFEQRAKDREAGLQVDDKPKRPVIPPHERAFLKARDYEVDLTQRLGKTQVISVNTPLSQQGGYYCDVCDCLVKDSANYLDHINGKKHQRALGVSMRTQRATLDEVRDKLKNGKKRDAPPAEDFDERVAYMKRKEEQDKKEKKEKRKKQKQDKEEQEATKKKKEESESSSNPIMAEMGLPIGFGGGRKN